MNTYIPQWKLRRLAPRAVRVVARHKEKSAAIGLYESTLVPAANKFVELYDASRTAQVSATENNQGAQAVEALRQVVRGWLGALSRDIPGFDIASFTDRQTVADDVIGSGQRLLEVCRNFKDRSGQPLPYQEAVVQALTPAIEAADAEWAEAQDRRVQEQAMRDATRDAAVLLHKELVALRRTLRAVLGTSHLDYRRLRAQASMGSGEEVEEEVEGAVDPLAPTSEMPAVKVPMNGASKEVALQIQH